MDPEEEIEPSMLQQKLIDAAIDRGQFLESELRTISLAALLRALIARGSAQTWPGCQDSDSTKSTKCGDKNKIVERLLRFQVG